MFLLYSCQNLMCARLNKIKWVSASKLCLMSLESCNNHKQARSGHVQSWNSLSVHWIVKLHCQKSWSILWHKPKLYDIWAMMSDHLILCMAEFINQRPVFVTNVHCKTMHNLEFGRQRFQEMRCSVSCSNTRERLEACTWLKHNLGFQNLRAIIALDRPAPMARCTVAIHTDKLAINTASTSPDFI